MAEFTANNAVSATTGISPFLANSGQHPRMGYEPPTGQVRPPLQRIQAEEASRFIEKMKAIEDYLKDEMRWAQATYETFANRRREPAPAFQVGDEVFVDARHIKTTRPTKKLDWKNLGPFRITKVVSSHAYRLELPPSLKIHDVLPTFRLRLAPKSDDILPDQRIESFSLVAVDEDDEYLVERIEDSRFN